RFSACVVFVEGHQQVVTFARAFWQQPQREIELHTVIFIKHKHSQVTLDSIDDYSCRACRFHLALRPLARSEPALPPTPATVPATSSPVKYSRSRATCRSVLIEIVLPSQIAVIVPSRSVR